MRWKIKRGQYAMVNRNILYIASEDTPGMRPYSASVMKAVWDENSWAVIVLRDESSKKDYSLLPQDKITYIYFPKSKMKKLFYHVYPVKLVKTINRLVKEHNIDLVHTLTGEITLAYVFSALQRKVKVLHTVHDAIGHDSKFSSRWEQLKAYALVGFPNKHIMGVADNLMSNSKHQISYLQKKYPYKKCFYAPFPTLVNDAIKNGTCEVPELRETKDYILFFGNVNLYKGVHLLYGLYTKYKAHFQGAKLVIAGAGNDYFGMDASDGDVIRLNRYIKDSEVKSLFMNAKLVVYPYVSATQSGVLSIASYFGKKMVLSRVPFFESAASGCEGVEIVDVTNETAFLNGIKRLMSLNVTSSGMYAELYDESRLEKSVRMAQDAILSN